MFESQIFRHLPDVPLRVGKGHTRPLPGRNDLALFSEPFRSVRLAETRSRERERERGRERTRRSLVETTAAIQMRRESGDGGNPPLFPPLTTS